MNTNSNAASSSSWRNSDDTFRSGNTGTALPPLNYTVHTPKRRLRIIIFSVLIFIEAGILPLILFYALKLGAHLSVTVNLAIITAFVGTFSGHKFGLRMWYMWFAKNGYEYRPIGSGRWGVDMSQILISIGLGGFFVPLIIGSSITPASPPAVAMALPCLMITICLPLLLTGLFPHRIRMPFRVSSLPSYEPLPPLTYTYVEDIVAVDGGGGLQFRHAWRERYEASTVMRKLLRDMALFWGFGGTLIAGALIAIAWTTAQDVGYGIGFGVPWIWAFVWTPVTVWWSRKELARERREWESAPQLAHREVSLHIKEGKEGEAEERIRQNNEEAAVKQNKEEAQVAERERVENRV
ncbi:hypothetical protein M422DRAFT_190877 [Sphaerobolus stellatus SS14]|uniref:Uncharacterized protein n=1 Tax=Sphaerobolus stellatus (strain SS14) TaxID=990650 RepID=A0A0C9TE44_SPHS4|nr:hypothetical protein M422DRAFT_190877 [Sphaerobolus stellatus SS14]